MDSNRKPEYREQEGHNKPAASYRARFCKYLITLTNINYL